MFKPKGRRELAESIVTLIARDRYYRQLGQSLREMNRIAGVLPWEVMLDGTTSFERFEKSRQAEIDQVVLMLSNLPGELHDLTDQVNQDCFDFNRVREKWRGYRSLVLSWDVPRTIPEVPGAYADFQPSYKFVAYNLTGHQITRPINQLEGASPGTRRVTRQVIKLAKQDRFARDIVELTTDIDQRLGQLSRTLELIERLHGAF